MLHRHRTGCDRNRDILDTGHPPDGRVDLCCAGRAIHAPDPESYLRRLDKRDNGALVFACLIAIMTCVIVVVMTVTTVIVAIVVVMIMPVMVMTRVVVRTGAVVMATARAMHMRSLCDRGSSGFIGDRNYIVSEPGDFLADRRQVTAFAMRHRHRAGGHRNRDILDAGHSPDGRIDLRRAGCAIHTTHSESCLYWLGHGISLNSMPPP